MDLIIFKNDRVSSTAKQDVKDLCSSWCIALVLRPLTFILYKISFQYREDMDRLSFDQFHFMLISKTDIQIDRAYDNIKNILCHSRLNSTKNFYFCWAQCPQDLTHLCRIQCYRTKADAVIQYREWWTEF